MTSNTLKQINEHFSPRSSQMLLLRIDLSLGTDLPKTQAGKPVPTVSFAFVKYRCCLIVSQS